MVDVCGHWWVNQDEEVDCLEAAEELANQTPVRLDLLLSLAPPEPDKEHVMAQPAEVRPQRDCSADRCIGCCNLQPVCWWIFLRPNSVEFPGSDHVIAAWSPCSGHLNLKRTVSGVKIVNLQFFFKT